MSKITGEILWVVGFHNHLVAMHHIHNSRRASSANVSFARLVLGRKLNLDFSCPAPPGLLGRLVDSAPRPSQIPRSCGTGTHRAIVLFAASSTRKVISIPATWGFTHMSAALGVAPWMPLGSSASHFGPDAPLLHPS